MNRAILFDLDGTLLDSEKVAAQAFAAAYRMCGGAGATPLPEFFALAGQPFEQICDVLGLPANMPQAFRAESTARAANLRLFPGVFDVLNGLAGSGIPIGIVTGKDRARAKAALRLVGIAHFVKVVVTPDDPVAAKPSGAGIHYAAARLGATKVIYVGDSEADVAAALDAGVVCCGCTWGISSGEVLRAAGAHRLVQYPWELGEFLSAWLRGLEIER